MRTITFDLETKNTFQDAGSNDPAALDMSVVCIHDSLDGSYRSFLQEQLKELWPILEQADLIVSFNGEHFDLPILNKYYSGDLSLIPHVDLLKEVKNSLGRRLKLDTIASATLGTSKSGHGLEAIDWWNAGEIDKLIKYCIDDVRITRELYDYARTNKQLRYKDGATIRDIKIDTSHWDAPRASVITYTLPL